MWGRGSFLSSTESSAFMVRVTVLFVLEIGFKIYQCKNLHQDTQKKKKKRAEGTEAWKAPRHGASHLFQIQGISTSFFTMTYESLALSK